MAKLSVQRTSNLLASITEEMLGTNSAGGIQEDTIRVEKLLLDLVRPHPVQPRRVLPERIHQAFHQQQLTPTQALRELVQIVQVAARQKSRPFTSVLDLLVQPEEETEMPTDLSPEETLLRDLINLAVTIRDDGQVNPLTVVDISEGVTRIYRIETGERRYWATWLLRDFIADSNSDGTIPCIVLPTKTASIFRQAKENTSRTGLTAIAMARQVALLLLSAHGYEIPDYPVDHDFYRQALELDLRGKRDYTEAILAAMGGLSKARFSHYKNLLHLSDEALELADRHNLDEGRLRYMVRLEPQFHAEMVAQIVQFNLTVKQIQDRLKASSVEDIEVTAPQIPRAAKQFLKFLKVADEVSPSDFVSALIRQEKDMNVAYARLKSFHAYLAEIEQAFVDVEKGIHE